MSQRDKVQNAWLRGAISTHTWLDTANACLNSPNVHTAHHNSSLMQTSHIGKVLTSCMLAFLAKSGMPLLRRQQIQGKHNKHRAQHSAPDLD